VPNADDILSAKDRTPAILIGLDYFIGHIFFFASDKRIQ